MAKGSKGSGNGKEKKSRRPSVKLDNRTFVKLWATGHKASEIATAMGTTVESVRAKATNLRKMGVDLPRMGGPNSVDVASLNELIYNIQEDNLENPEGNLESSESPASLFAEPVELVE